MKGFFIIAIIVVIASILLLTWQPGEEATETATVLPPMLSVGGEATAPATASPTTEEVRMTSEGFFPAVYRVAAGDQLDLVFLFEEKEFVTIEDAGIAEYIQAGTIQVTFDHPGTYDLTCLSCDDPYLATILVS